MNKYMLGEDGQPLLDHDGKKILNPEWLAANPNYTPTPDETGESGGGGYTPDAAALAWHNSQTEGLRQNQQRALGQLRQARKRATDAESERDQFKSENEELRATIESAGSSNEELKASLEAKHDLHKKNLQADLDKANTTISNLKGQLSEHLYDGRIKSASMGVIRKGYEVPAMAALKAMIKETDDGEVICYDANNQPLLDKSGEYMSVEDFIGGHFRKLYPDMCQRDVGADDEGDPTIPGSSGGANVFKEGEHFNRTAQFQMIKNDPQQARSLMKRAGYNEGKINRMLANIRPAAA